MSHSYATAIRDGLVSFSVAVEADPTQVVGRWRVPPCSMSSDALQPAPCSSMGTGAAPGTIGAVPVLTVVETDPFGESTTATTAPLRAVAGPSMRGAEETKEEGAEGWDEDEAREEE